MFVKGSKLDVKVDCSPDLPDCTYMLRIIKPACYVPVDNQTDDSISAAFRKSQKVPLVSIVSDSSNISVPPEKMSQLPPGDYCVIISVMYSGKHNFVYNEEGTLLIVEPLKCE